MQIVSHRSPVPYLVLAALATAAVLALREQPAEATPAPAATAEVEAPAEEPPQSDGILRAGLESPHIFDGGDGIAHLGVVITPPSDAASTRAPVALSLVVDTSQSMGGLKIEHARYAARAIVGALADGDRLSIIDYDSDARVLVPLTRLDAGSRTRILGAIDGLVDDGWTALFAGVQAGLKTLDGIDDATRRLVLLSDGQANVGPETPDAIVSGLTPGETTLSSIGIGTDYDAAVMTAVADLGRGGLHHLTDPSQLAGMLASELEAARTVVGRQAVIEVEVAPGVEFMDVAGLEVQRVSDRVVRIPVGDLYANEARSVSARVKVPVGGPRTGAVGTVRLTYAPIDGAPLARDARVDYRLSGSLAEVEKTQRPLFMITADRMRVSHVLLDAARLLEEGDLLEAQALMRDERARLAQRRARLDGDRQAELDALMALFRDPYVDADLKGNTAKAMPAVSLDALVESVRTGQHVADAQLAALDADALRVLRNTAYARHGYRFKSADLNRFFGKQSWYRPDADFDPGRLTKTDVDLITRVKHNEGRASMSAAAKTRPRAVKTVDEKTAFEALFQGRSVTGLDLSGWSLADLRVLRNTVYALRGYAFRSSDLRAHFSTMGWYTPDPAYTPAKLTAVDVRNVQHIKTAEQALVARADASAVRDLTLRSRARARQVVR